MVKQAEGALIQALASPRAGSPRRVQVYQTILDAILGGQLAAGERLPSARQLAQDWRVARGVVDEAFARLQDEGLIVRRVGDGTYVNHPLPRRARASAQAPAQANEAARRVLDMFAPYFAQSSHLQTVRKLIDPPLLHPRGWPAQDFPLQKWRRCAAAAWHESARIHMGYGQAAGMPELRQALARHVALTRSLPCKPEQVVVLNSPMQGVETMVRVMLAAGDEVWVEDPGHPSLPLLLEMLHMKPVSVPLDTQGLCVDVGRARAPNARLVYTHPLTQYPLGLRTTAARQRELLQWAEDSGAWILEGMFNDEIVHRPPAPPALASQPGGQRVVLMGTLEGVMFPALRVAYLVVPEHLVDVFVAARGLMGDHNATGTQIALANFMNDGHLNTHLRTLARRCGERRAALQRAVAQHLQDPASGFAPGAIQLSPTDTGIHACIHLAPSWPDREVAAAMRRQGIGTESLSSRCWQAGGHNGLIVSFGAAEPGQIDEAVRRMAQLLRSL